MNGYLIALVLLVAALIIWGVMLTHRLLWSECRHVIDQHLGRHLVLGLALLSLLAIVVPPAAFQLGRDTQTRHDAAYFAQRYKNTGLPTVHLARVVTSAPARPTAPAVGIDTLHFPGVFDQSTVGMCAGISSSEALSFHYRITHLSTHPGINFNPCFLYSHYSCKYNGCQDGGSWPVQNVEDVPTVGVPQMKLYQCPQSPQNLTPQQYPALFDNAAKFKQNVSVATLYLGDPSDVVYDDIKTALATGEPALVSINVPPSWDNATMTGGNINYAGAEGSRGGHEIVALRADDTHIMADGSPAVLIQNSWSRQWGANGRAWVSRKWLAANAWGVLVFQYGTSTVKTGQATKVGPPSFLKTK